MGMVNVYDEDGQLVESYEVADGADSAEQGVILLSTVQAAEVIQDEITQRLLPINVNSIAETKTAMIEGLAAAVDRLRGG